MLSSRGAVVALVATLMILQTSLAQEETATKRCRMIKCRPVCRPGKGADGCPICDCPSTCQDYPCDDGYACELQPVQCFKEPCYPAPNCVAVQEETTTKPCRMLKCRPDCKPGKGEDGCPICDCPPTTPTCENYPCDDGYACELKTVQCVRAPCNPVPTCVAVVQEPAVECPMVKCAPYCVPDRGDDGCPTCACDGPTCENYACDAGSVCQLETVACFTTPCYPQPTCVAAVQEETPSSCPMIKCSPDCLPGTGSDGCPSCDCPARPSCQTVRCSAGNECQLVKVTCKTDPCYPQPQCVPVKSAGSCTACAKNCFSLKIKKNKCPRCFCPDPCKRKRCPSGYECKLSEETSDSRTPFLPKPYCAPKSCPTEPEPCGIRCMYGLKTDRNGCQLCECLSAPPRS